MVPTEFLLDIHGCLFEAQNAEWGKWGRAILRSSILAYSTSQSMQVEEVPRLLLIVLTDMPSNDSNVKPWPAISTVEEAAKNVIVGSSKITGWVLHLIWNLLSIFRSFCLLFPRLSSFLLVPFLTELVNSSPLSGDWLLWLPLWFILQSIPPSLLLLLARGHLNARAR